MMLKPGDRIRLLAMPNDPDPLPEGATGTVVRAYYHEFFESAQVFVRWDPPNDRRNLALIMPPDRVALQ
jgi:hypothetical protein